MNCVGGLFAAGVLAFASSTVLAFPDGAPAGFDGSPSSGFTGCFLCHTGPTGAGSVDLLGRPTRYVPDRIYSLDLRVFDPVQFGAGFEISVETPAGVSQGALLLTDSIGTQYASGNPQYVTHTLDGHHQSEVEWVANGNVAVFHMQWRAPSVDVGDIAFYLSVNADNDDGFTTGDSIYTVSFPAAFNSCLADLNADGTVDGADLATLLTNWGSVNPDADLNGDGVVNGADLATMLTNWGGCAPI